MKYFLDTEFSENGKHIDLISIGVVAEDGRELYRQCAEFEPAYASPWVQANVFPHLQTCSTSWPLGEPRHVFGQCRRLDCVWRGRGQIAYELSVFLDPKRYGKPEIWGWCAAYDFVVLCQLFGTMMELPEDWPHYIRDLQFLLDLSGIADEQLPPQQGAHHALADAHYIQQIVTFLEV